MFDRAFWYYFSTFVALVAAGVGFPIPEELPIVTAGALVGHASEPTVPASAYADAALAIAPCPLAPWPGTLPWAALAWNIENPAIAVATLPRLRWWIMIPVCILGVVISDGLLYGMGRFFGRRLLERPFMARLVPPDKQKSIEENFHQYGVLVLLFARFLPTIRSPIFIMAGVLRMPFAKFVMADGIYAIPGVNLLFWLAFWFGDQFREVILRAENEVSRLKPLLILLVIAAIGGYLLYHFIRHPVATGDPRQEVPIVGDKVAEAINLAPGEGEEPANRP